MEEIRLADIPPASAPRGIRGLLTRFLDWRHLVAVGAACCLCLSLLFYLYIAVTRALIFYVLFPASLMLFGVMLWQGRLLRHTDIKLLLAAFIWLNLSCIMNAGRASFGDCVPYYANACTVALLCYPLAYVLSEKRRMKSFDLMAGLWTVPIACSSIVGIVFTLTRTLIFRSSDSAPMGMVDGRLYLILDPNMYGMLLCMGICFVLYLLLGKRKPLVRVLLVLAALCMYAALSLTGSRTAQCAMPFAALFFAALLIWNLLIKKPKLVRLAAGVATGLAFAVLLFVGYRAVNIGLNALIVAPVSTQSETSASQTVSRIAAPAALQDGVTPPDAGSNINTARDFSDSKSIFQRLEIWHNALTRLMDEKDVLLRGATPALTLSMFIDPAFNYNHLHNAYLGTLLSYGLPGFILMLVFLIYLAVCACKLLFSPRVDLPLSIRFLPVILIPILVINMFEEMLFTRDFISELNVWLAIIGGYTVVLSRQWRHSTSRTKSNS